MIVAVRVYKVQGCRVIAGIVMLVRSGWELRNSANRVSSVVFEVLVVTLHE